MENSAFFFLLINKKSRLKFSKNVEALNNTINQHNLTGIYRILHPQRAKCTFFSRAHRMFTKMDHILDHKTNLGNFNTYKVCSLSTKELNQKSVTEKSGKSSNIYKLNNTFLNTHGSKKKSQGKLKHNFN